jgi:poly-gamma-glutamate capsule biosynthesis protein CapA/YwtB (metallophosphatase superfamily)
MKRKLSLLLLAAALTLTLSACGLAGSAETPAPTPIVTVAPTPEPTPTPTPVPTPTVIELCLAGDLVMHTPLNDEALQEDGSYDYAPIFEDVAGYVAEADYAQCTLECALTGDGKWMGYPTFHTPDGIAYSLKNVGFDLINMASNHTMDGWKDGIDRTLDVLDDAGLDHVGAYRTQAERDENNGILVKDIGGVTIAFLNYTYGTNGFPVWDYPYAVNVYYLDYLDYFTKIDYDMIDADMACARALGTDLIAVTVHWGGEYVTGSTEQQRSFADYLFAAGADLVIGGHPHVPEPMELRTVTDEAGRERTGFLCYCLGNLLSCQDKKYTNLTSMVQLQITKDNVTGETAVTGCGYVPMVMVDLYDYGVYGQPWRYRLWDLRQAIADYEAGNNRGVMTQGMYNAFVQNLADCRKIFGALEAPMEVTP